MFIELSRYGDSKLLLAMEDDNDNQTASTNVSPGKSVLGSPVRITFRTRSYSCSVLEPPNRAAFHLSYSPTNEERTHLLGTSGSPGYRRQFPSQGSLVTIFSIWSTLVGTTILTVPWAISQAGFWVSIGSYIAAGLVTFYPIQLMFEAAHHVEMTTFRRARQFSEVCKEVLGQKMAVFSVFVSLFNLLGDMICYWIMLSSLLYEIGCYLNALRIPELNLWNPETNSTVFDVELAAATTPYWNESVSVPLYMVLLIFPFICLRYPTFFTKFSSLGMLSIAYLFIFVVVKISAHGINVAGVNLLEVKSSFPALSGTLFAGYLVHNVIIAMTAYSSVPHNNSRDTGVAFFLGTLTYILLAGGYYLAFPGPKSEISDNFIKDFAIRDTFAFVARLLMFFQIVTLFPLLAYVFRIQLFFTWLKRADVGSPYVIILNVCLVAACLLFAGLYPRIGDILRILGAFCGLVYICVLPFIIQITIAYKSGQPVILKCVIFFLYLALGTANFVAQFVMSLI